ncbi:hypothetical protein BSF37_21795 [Serratia marcescens]|uniref:hypothetical protein n=1 Tax=Serratia marcescens TaxID=615 RepID=UPI00147AB4F8|nr:hypothetical protein [Serratia marcescens]NMM74432.1 hypothetical protein [Serratia marcescens]
MRKLTFVLITLLSVMVYAEKYGVAAIKAVSSESSLFAYGMASQAVAAGNPASQLVLVLIAVALLVAALLVASLVTAAAVFAAYDLIAALTAATMAGAHEVWKLALPKLSGRGGAE